MALARYIIRRAHTASYSTSSSILQSALPLPSESTTHSTCAKNRGSKHNNHHQNGYGKIVAVSSAPSSGLSTTVHTYFTELRHSSPMRLVPSRRTHPTSYNMQNRHENEASNRSHRCEGALVHLSSYGGGLVPGDKLTLDIDVRGKGAMLAVMTQGGQRIYRPGEHFRMYENYKHGIRRTSETSARSKPNSELDTSKVCQSTINCSISPGATLFYLPDPTVPYRSSSFEERRVFNCQFASAASDSSNNNNGSLIAVDWYSSGRTYSADIEERWAFDYLATRTELYITDVSNTCTQELVRPNLIESMSFGNKGASDRSPPAATSMGQSFDAMATLLLHGPTSTPVAKRAMELERKLAGSLTRIRRDDSDSEERTNGNIDGLDQLLDSLGGQVLLSVTQVEHDIVKQQQQLHNNNTHMVRILAENNEDIYRALNYCLKECSVHFGGLEPYKERIHSSKTVREKNIPLSMQQQKERRQNKGDDLQAIVDQLCLFPVRNSNSNSNNAWFRVCTLSDSSLPVGSFAHSQGIEAASQMQLFRPTNHNEQFLANNRSQSCSIEALSDFIYSVSRSNARFSTPLIMSGYSLIQQTEFGLELDQLHQLWSKFDVYTDTMLLTNRPGRRASIDQGLGLVRIASSFADDRNDNHDSDNTADLWALINHSIDTNGIETIQSRRSSINNGVPQTKGHAAPIYGILSATLGITPLDSCRVFAFGAARDAVSAAVRLNLIGPMSGLNLLDRVGRKAVEDGLEEGLVGMLHSSRELSPDEFCSAARIDRWLQSVHTCAPMLDTAQPLADLLSVRLFRT